MFKQYFSASKLKDVSFFDIIKKSKFIEYVILIVKKLLFLKRKFV